MSLAEFSQGQTIIQYGDPGDCYFVLKDGTIKVKIYQPEADPQDPHLESLLVNEKLLTSSEQQMVGFGEIALLMNDRRKATVVANTPCSCWVLPLDVFKRIVQVNITSRR